MNKLEEVNKNSNYDIYLTRMENSYFKSSKNFLPLLCKGKRVLDVGCASGTLLKPLKDMGFDAVGIDLNQTAVDKCHDLGLDVENINLYELKDSFDTIIFSSVLHEFSSYDRTDKYRYTKLPILTALMSAYKHLNSNGQILIRDGIKASDEVITVNATSYEVIKDFKQYVKDAPMYKDTTFLISGTSITAQASLIKEFAYTYTWGKASYSREVNEQYGILTVEDWLQIIRIAKFKINNVIISSDDYIKYVSKFFIPNDKLTEVFEQSTIIINAEKED